MNLLVFAGCLLFAGWVYWTWPQYGDAPHFMAIATLAVVLTDQICRALRYEGR